MQISWQPEHSEALRDYLAKGLSFAEIARAINARFHTAYSRNATIGRARRMGLAGPARSDHRGRPKRQRKPRPTRLQRMRKRRVAKPRPSRPVQKRAAALKLRCVAIVPRHLSLLELEPNDCRYPFGGDEDGEAITFCGHPRRQGSSYCVSHFHLTRGPGSASERGAVKVLLRLVEAA
jgi:GcrA cell cycle regulator